MPESGPFGHEAKAPGCAVRRRPIAASLRLTCVFSNALV
ncbi:hypothetical protein FHS34_001812 [Streptomyces echinatus]|uniref:Uncharacterized protein n=1 Tax=Streptomyces echinatus TaxID=67293 RepID=A0A7W9UPY1_9ACTN|nr:hypothetical protein [Streptomyces echinatus]